MVTMVEMIEDQLVARGVTDERVVAALEAVNRAEFVPEELRKQAYEDMPLPIPEGQTISQPYIVGFMAQALNLAPDARVLEIGTGCGYNAAVLSRICERVYSIEVVERLARLAEENVSRVGIDNVVIRCGDGFTGWKEEAPFDAITITAAPPSVPEPLKRQLKLGGFLLAPVGTHEQTLILYEKKTAGGVLAERTLLPVRFVPMTGKAQVGGGG